MPVTYGYISDAHDCHAPNTTTDAYVSTAQGPARAAPTSQLAVVRRRVRARSSRTWPRTGSTSRTRCSSSPSTRATTSPAAPARRSRRHARLRARELHRPDRLPGQPDRRGEREPAAARCRPAARRSASTPTTRRPSTWPATRTAPTRGAQARARPRRDDAARSVRTTTAQATPITQRSPTRSGNGRCTWSTPTRPDADVHALRQPRLLLHTPARTRVRRRTRASHRASPGTTATSRTEIGNTWLGSSGPGVASRASTRRLDRPHEHPADDHGTHRAQGRLPARRPRAHEA